MPHISKQFLKGDAEKRLVDALVGTVTVKGSARRRDKIFRELLTGIERLMLAKRLAIVVMLARGIPVDAISDKLKVSPSTVSRLRGSVEAGNYSETLRATKREKVDDLVIALFKTLALGPRQRNAPRWQWLRNI